MSASSLVSSVPNTVFLATFSLGLGPMKLRKKLTNLPFLLQGGRICACAASWKPWSGLSCEDAEAAVVREAEPPDPAWLGRELQDWSRLLQTKLFTLLKHLNI